MTALPESCVLTNANVSAGECGVHDLAYYPKWLLAVMSISAVFLIAAPVAVRRRCKLKYAVRGRISWLRSIWRLAAGALLVGAAVGQVYFGITQQLLAFLLAWAAIVVSVMMIFVWAPPLRVVRCEDESFWVKGCCPEFLADLRQMGSAESGSASVD